MVGRKQISTLLHAFVGPAFLEAPGTAFSSLFAIFRFIWVHLCALAAFFVSAWCVFCVRLVGRLLLISGRLSDHPVFPFGVPSRLPKEPFSGAFWRLFDVRAKMQKCGSRYGFNTF